MLISCLAKPFLHNYMDICLDCYILQKDLQLDKWAQPTEYTRVSMCVHMCVCLCG